ncbi:hypothetical protein ACTZWW_04395 [Salinarimonas sp. NSM]|uniref:hypothetical protein n=1 Tax=Salinarimonas sp. NSM TaxID=3458003 RepID=UPI004036997B
MICTYCGTDTVTWRGPWSNLTHTECERCGRQNCQEIATEGEPDADDGDDAHADTGDVLGMAGLVAFTASAVVLASVLPADAATAASSAPGAWFLDLTGAAVQVAAGALAIGAGVGGLAYLGQRVIAWLESDGSDDVELDYRDAESRGGRADG